MKITKIRNKDGSKVDLDSVAAQLGATLQGAGYITNVKIVNSTRIDIGMHMCSFRVDVKRHGYNARYNPHMNYKLGYKRTSTPTWAQRVEFNELVNSVLNLYFISANVRSGDFTIRAGDETFDENDWLYQKPDYMRQNESSGFTVEAIK